MTGSDSRNVTSDANLDELYIPARYPNGFDAGIPGEYYNRNDADEAIKRSEEILKYVRREISCYLLSFSDAGIAVDVFPFAYKEIKGNSFLERARKEGIQLS